MLLACASKAPRCRCSVWLTARPWFRCDRPRTSNASATMSGPTPVAWGLFTAAVAARRGDTRHRHRCRGTRCRRPGPGDLPVGLLYAGLAIDSKGPAVVELLLFRGDPETQAVLALLESPLGQLLHATATGTLADFGPLKWDDGYAVTVVVAAENYPGRPRVGDAITGSDAEGVLQRAPRAATTGPLRFPGGRVLSVVGTVRPACGAHRRLRCAVVGSIAGQPLPVRHRTCRRRGPDRVAAMTLDRGAAFTAERAEVLALARQCSRRPNGDEQSR